MFYEEDEYETLTHKERQLKELHARRTEDELYVLLNEALDKLHNNFQEE